MVTACERASRDEVGQIVRLPGDDLSGRDVLILKLKNRLAVTADEQSFVPAVIYHTNAQTVTAAATCRRIAGFGFRYALRARLSAAGLSSRDLERRLAIGTNVIEAALRLA
jgi:hypothetical protein